MFLVICYRNTLNRCFRLYVVTHLFQDRQLFPLLPGRTDPNWRYLGGLQRDAAMRPCYSAASLVLPPQNRSSNLSQNSALVAIKRRVIRRLRAAIRLSPLASHPSLSGSHLSLSNGPR
jgi:hypothetical protein